MDVPHNQVIFPSNFTELFSAWSRFPDAVLFAAGTSFMRTDIRAMPDLPKNILSLERIEELRRVTRTERYLEIGAMVRLSEITALGKIVPSALAKTLENLESPRLRNIATLGGSICGLGTPGGGADAAAPLAALDSRYELRTAGQTRWISSMRFSTLSAESSATENQEILTRIRVPLEQWDYTVYRKFHDRDLGKESGHAGGVLICAAKTEKGMLAELRVVFAGTHSAAPEGRLFCILRDRNSETFLEGKKLPLDCKDVLHYRGLWEEYLSGPHKLPVILKAKILNRTASCILCLAD